MSDQPTRSELLDVIGEVKARTLDKLGSVDFPIPQFILIGKQSVGKSRLIEALAGENFNFVSGTLGSRRPTVLEFRTAAHRDSSQWSVMNVKTKQWQTYTVDQVMRILGDAHESLKSTVSDQPVYVRVEGPHVVDMQIVDLPGFRDFALDQKKQTLSDQIEAMVTKFMKDERNVMICVEEAGDAANLSSLTRCKRLDPNFKRTILVRNKLDKYYRDLTAENINQWLNGFGDLPENLTSFALSLPHWKEGLDHPPEPFIQLREAAAKKDVSEMKSRGASEKFMKGVGFDNFVKLVENKIEQLFVASIGPITRRLKELEGETREVVERLQTEIDTTHPNAIVSTVRDAGRSFAAALEHVMWGYVKSDVKRLSLDEELRSFHQYHEAKGNSNAFLLLPSDDFACLDDYIDCLRDEMNVPAMDVEINGGAQLRRLLTECEIFIRFAEISSETKRTNVIQARGISLGTVTWQDVVVKLLSHEGHLPMKARVRYVAERIKWFFLSQKDVMMDFMKKVKGAPDEHLFSALLPQAYVILTENKLVNQHVFETYDKACDRQTKLFIDLFDNTLASTFANPWVFLKRASTNFENETFDDVCMPSFEETKERIPEEIDQRGGIEQLLNQMIALIPHEASMVDEAVDRAQMLLLRTFQFIRAQIADQIELFVDSFFKLPLLRRLEEDMNRISLSSGNLQASLAHTQLLTEELTEKTDAMTELVECQNKIKTLSIRARQKQK